jgi:hypothetical protein
MHLAGIAQTGSNRAWLDFQSLRFAGGWKAGIGLAGSKMAAFTVREPVISQSGLLRRDISPITEK